MATNKGFIKDWAGNTLLPISRGELILDQYGKIALFSDDFLATSEHAGLMSAAEKAMLSGSSGGQSLTDLYTKINYINNGLKVNGSVVNFYDSDGNSTPINITGTTAQISIGTANNVITIGLDDIHSGLSASSILKSITVDKYGRVTDVLGAPLTNAEIPTELSGKTISDSTLNGCTTANEDIGTDTKAIANKYYVDKKITEITGLATGALKFGGLVGSTDAAIAVISNENYYYKASATFTLTADYLYDSTTAVTVQTGDTLIVYNSKLVHIPSGDDITKIIVREEGGEDVMTSGIGNVTFQFSSIFNVENLTTGSNIATISMPQANASTDGYLSKTDYALFKSYADSLSTSYSPTVTASTTGAYTLGTLIVGSAENIIYGINNITSLVLNDNTASTGYNPILKFTETGTNGSELSITYLGLNGVVVKKDGNTIQFLANNQVNTTSANYLKITDGYKFDVILGTHKDDGTIETQGLTDYSVFLETRNRALLSTTFSAITGSLYSDSTSPDATYNYGNTALVTAITVTI